MISVLKSTSEAFLNSGDKVFAFDLMEGLTQGTSGLKQVMTNAQRIKRCKFYPLYNRNKGFIHPHYLQTV